MVIIVRSPYEVTECDDQSGNENVRNKVFPDKIIVDEISTITAG
jgi:hypothetical protein